LGHLTSSGGVAILKVEVKAMSENENPYASPTDSSPGVYDWTLAKRIFLWFSVIAACYLAFDAVVLWQSWDARTLPSDATLVEQVKAFFFGWQGG
jgi:hypothetical protein